MTTISQVSPEKLPVINTLSQTFRLWGQNLVYFSLLGLMFRGGIYLFEVSLEAASYLFKVYIHMMIRLGLLMAVQSLLTYGFYLLITRRCHHYGRQGHTSQLHTEQVHAPQRPLPKISRLNPALLLAVLTFVVFLPLFKLGTTVFLIVNPGPDILFSQLPFLVGNIPGYILALIFFIFIPVAVIEQPGPDKALERCLDLSRGHRWSLFWLFLFTGLFLTLIAQPVSYLLPLIPQGGFLISEIWFDYHRTGATLVQGLTAPFVALLWYSAYTNLAGIKYSQSPEQLNRIFE
ncbi:hypothetical protein [Kiloniella laminariae]|uniref:hypothetical protein n=1 Tax=Kiloniella laminariae TaxID=454162 RepID=UPI0003748C19|nr:hypothetical protein [Kiloniella laminariae]